MIDLARTTRILHDRYRITDGLVRPTEMQAVVRLRLHARRADELGRCVPFDVHALAVEIAALPDCGRDHEGVKLGTVTAHRNALADALGRSRAPVMVGEPC